MTGVSLCQSVEGLGSSSPPRIRKGNMEDKIQPLNHALGIVIGVAIVFFMEDIVHGTVDKFTVDIVMSMFACAIIVIAGIAIVLRRNGFI